MKIVLAGALGGIAMFIWASLAHMALPFGEAGLREIPNDLPWARGANFSLCGHAVDVDFS
jgi:hypothetical protein